MTGGEEVVFWLLAPLAVLGGIGMVFSRKAVHAALWLALTMIVLAVFFGVQGALFLGVVQVVVYTGAVLMLFLFVLMLVGVDASDSLVETIRGQRFASLLAFLAFGLLLVGGISRVSFAEPLGVAAANAKRGGNAEGVAELIFTRYVWAFEVTGALLITAAVGAMVLTHRERTEARPSQRELARQRFHSRQPSMLPPPGVYARHNAVDTPALLPDGRPAEESVSPALRARGEVHERRRAEIAEPGQVSHAVEVAEGRESR
jgi:NADH-quinone oxidoreductase subunit J